LFDITEWLRAASSENHLSCIALAAISGSFTALMCNDCIWVAHQLAIAPGNFMDFFASFPPPGLCPTDCSCEILGILTIFVFGFLGDAGLSIQPSIATIFVCLSYSGCIQN
jgi:hypothetical protein